MHQLANLANIARCPRCLSGIVFAPPAPPRCSNVECALSSKGFLQVDDQPVLIDFETSIFDPGAYDRNKGYVLPRDNTGRSIRTRVRRFITGTNSVAERNGKEFLRRLHLLAERPRVLIIGGGAIGDGAQGLYDDAEIDVIGTDVYASPLTCTVVDGHHLPFCSEAFHGVWIQAVLEHVLEPHVIAAEIYRVLKSGGLVYSEIPFMQQVHEGAYDFSRFSLSGHRWLFKQFEQVAAGSVGGAGTASVWSFRYLCRALGAGDKLATLLSLAVFYLRFMDRFTQRRPNADAAAGTYFLGTKSQRTLAPREMVRYYEEQTRP
jgi:SAM-dependent methyltransferase